MPYPLPLTRTEAYLAYKAGVIQQSDLKPSLAVPRNGIDAWLAYWTGLAADYPKREDGTPHILQEEEAYIAYLSGVINEYPEKCLRRVGAYLRYLISARWGRPDHPLNREELYLSLIKTQFIPSGDPSSDIEIDGTAKAAFVDVKMYGDTFQKSYTGKNLLNLSAPRGANSGTDYSFDVSSGVLTVTKSSASAVNRYSGWYVTGLTPGAKYTFSIESFTNSALSNADRAIMIRSYNGTSASELVTLNKTQTSYTFTAPNDSVRLEFFFYVASGNTDSTSIITKPMLEAGETATTYEPFVGGQASPNPDYPQAIQTVTGRQVVKVEGKNLIDMPIVSGSHNGVTWVVNYDGSITLNGTATANAHLTANNVSIPAVAGETYTLSATGLQGIVNFGYKNVGSGRDILVLTPGSPVKTVQITEEMLADANRLDMFIVSGSTFNNQRVTLQLEKGSTATAYEPYSSNDYEINLGKNLFNKDNVVKGIPQVSDGSIGQVTSIGRTCQFIPVMPNTVYSHTGHPLGWAVVAWYKADKSFIRRDADIATITSPSEAAYASVSCALGNLNTCQFEAGEPTNYAPYFEPIELCKIGTYQDYIYKNGGEWKIRSRIVKTKLVSTLSGWSISSFDTQKRLYIPSQNAFGAQVVYYSTNNDPAPQVCSHFTNISVTELLGGETGIAISSSGYLSIRDNNQETAQGFKDWIDENEPVAYAVRATPTDIPITNPALIAQLDSLVNGGAEDGTTYIKVNATDPNLPGLLYVEAPKYE